MYRLIRFVLFSSLGLIIAPTNVSANVYLEYSQEMADVLKKSTRALEFISNIKKKRNIVLFAGGSLNNRQVQLTSSSKDYLSSCFSNDRFNDKCNENDLLERTPQTDVSNWYGFIRTMVRDKGAVILSGKDGHIVYLLKQLSGYEGIKFYVRAINVKNSSPLIYVSTNLSPNASYLDGLIGVYPFDADLQQISGCSFICNRSQEYDFGSRCLNKVRGVVEGFLWKYPSAPMSSDFISCPPDTDPPFPQIMKGETRLVLPYSRKSFFSALTRCWSSQNLAIDLSEVKFAPIQIKTLVRVSSANKKTLQHLPKKMLTELRMGLGVKHSSYPIFAERSLLISLNDCQ